MKNRANRWPLINAQETRPLIANNPDPEQSIKPPLPRKIQIAPKS